MINYIAQKQLDAAETLKLKTWISDVVEPGRRLYQIDLVQESPGVTHTIQFPTKPELFSMEQIISMYNAITTKSDFETLRQTFE